MQNNCRIATFNKKVFFLCECSMRGAGCSFVTHDPGSEICKHYSGDNAYPQCKSEEAINNLLDVVKKTIFQKERKQQ